jgi:peroxiredoxin
MHTCFQRIVQFLVLALLIVSAPNDVCNWLAGNPCLAQESNSPADTPVASDVESSSQATEDFQSKQETASEEPAEANGATVDEILAGHSYHGETFDEGPRRQAYLMGGTGDVHFPATTKVETVQQFIDQGVGQLHGFWYLEAERSFRQAAALDPDCAIAYWGAAMANKNNTDRARGFMAEAVSRKDKSSKREQMYIEALDKFLKKQPVQKDNKGEEKKLSSEEISKEKRKRAESYTRDLEEIVYDFPDDLEAKAFLILQLYDNRNYDIPLVSYYAVDALLSELFDKAPMHPAHHYRIHLWDQKHAELALQSAATCGQTSPRIAHMWHMPGHIYSRLNRYEDAVWQQEASARVDHAHMMRDHLLPDQIFNFAHNNEWLIRNMIYIGRVDDAIALARNMLELPRHPKYNTLQKRGSSQYGRDRLYDILIPYGRWQDVIELSNAIYLNEAEEEADQTKRLKYLGAAYAMEGDAEQSAECLQDLQSRLNNIQAEQQKEIDQEIEKIRTAFAAKASEANAQNSNEQQAADQVVDDAVDTNAKSDAQDSDAQDADAQDADAQETEAEDSEAEETDAQGEEPVKVDGEQSEQATDPQQADDPELKKQIEEATRKIKAKFASRIRNLEKSISVVKGYTALQAEDFKTAAEELKSGGEASSLILEARLFAGEQREALAEIEKELGRSKHQVIPAARQVFMLHAADKTQEAKAALENLRKMSGSIDMQSTLFTRLIPIAKELGFAEDWRLDREIPQDVGQRPALDALGPLCWQPWQAPTWSLKQTDEKTIGSLDYTGKPVVIIFYLGHGCLHCAEQLQAFNPETGAFAEAGISLLAISSDDFEGLQKSIEAFEGKLNLPLVSDGELTTFKAFGAFDDFENQPLHGTFLIDGKGKVRWQDISFEPFMDHKFLLQEAIRLLKIQPVQDSLTQVGE